MYDIILIFFFFSFAILVFLVYIWARQLQIMFLMTMTAKDIHVIPVTPTRSQPATGENCKIHSFNVPPWSLGTAWWRVKGRRGSPWALPRAAVAPVLRPFTAPIGAPRFGAWVSSCFIFHSSPNRSVRPHCVFHPAFTLFRLQWECQRDRG